MKRALLAFAVLAVTAAPAPAQVVYDNGPPVLVRGRDIIFGTIIQPFTLERPIAFNQLGFDIGVSFCCPTFPITFDYTFGLIDGPALFSGSARELFRSAIGMVERQEAYQTRISLGERTLAAGTYTLALSARFPSEGTLYALPNAAQDPLAFQLLAVSTIPEPTSFALTATGLLGALGVVSRRRRTLRSS